VFRGNALDAVRCDARLAAKFARAEARGGATCPTAGDAAAIQQALATHVGALLDALGGPAPLCGNGIRSAHEGCDGTDLGGVDCVQLGYGGGGELACDALCQLDASACVPGPACDLLAQDCPLAGYGCYALSGGNQCLPAGSGALDEACSIPTDCGAGLTCIAPHSGTPARCLALCDPSASTCPAERPCTELLAAPSVGVCLAAP
jgi:hypothetical protein